jgi:hypothetical protein
VSPPGPSWNSVEGDSYETRRRIDDAIARWRRRRCCWMAAVRRLDAGGVSGVSPCRSHPETGTDQGRRMVSLGLCILCTVHCGSQRCIFSDHDSNFARRSFWKRCPGSPDASIVQRRGARPFRTQFDFRNEGHRTRIHSAPECWPDDTSRRVTIDGARRFVRRRCC